MDEKDIEAYLAQLEDGWLSEDDLDGENSNDENDADEIVRVLQEENADDDVIDIIGESDSPLVEENVIMDQEPSHSVTPHSSSASPFDKRQLV